MSEIKTFVISRTVNAPRELVWKVWTDPDHLQKWFGPKGVTMPNCTMDFRVGGSFFYTMRNPDGTEMSGKWIFTEITPPERIAVTSSFTDSEGNTIRPPFPIEWPLHTASVTSFKDVNGKTEITIEWKPLDATDEQIDTFNNSFASMNGGWNGTFEQLESYLAAIQ
jgi:uncharacterized protein YndB with AHSA1/START domain